MFDTLFRYPGVLARHRDGPSSHERELFLTHCACMGTSHPTLLCLASELLLVARYLDLSDNRLINPQEIEVACSRWVRHQRRLRRIRDATHCRQRFVQVATDWLRFLGRLVSPSTKPIAFGALIDEFAGYMRDARGLP
jgi:integrase/recombinase XerD